MDEPKNNIPAPIGVSDRLSPDDEFTRLTGYELATASASAPPEQDNVREYDATHTDESMSGGYASVNGKMYKERSNKAVYIVLIAMTILCIAVGICSSILTGIFMRKGEKPPVIDTDGKTQQNVSAVVAARKSSIAEVYCSGLSASGIVMRRSGNNVTVLTNAHVIASYVTGEIKPSVRFYGEDGYFEANVVGYNGQYDVAVLNVVHETSYTVYDLDGSEYFSPDTDFAEGDYVVSIGNAMGMGIASYAGIISRKSELLECDELFGKSGKKVVPVSRTTAVINAGMSGCGVFDMSGRLVGLGTYRMSNSAGVDTEGGSSTDVEDTGFFTPMSVLYPIYKQIVENGNGGAVSLMGISAHKAGRSLAIGGISMPFGFDCEYRNGKLVVSSLDLGTAFTPIAKINDVVVSIGGTAVTDDICKTIGMLLRFRERANGRVLQLDMTRSGSPYPITVDVYRYAL